MQANWNTPAGRALQSLAKAISERGLKMASPIVVFGSAALQIFVDETLLSGDVDISAGKQAEEVKAIVDEIGYGKQKAPFYIEVVPLYVFRAGQNWAGRTQLVELHGVQFLFPDAIDILLGKLRRLDPKDLRAFDAVKAKLRRPTEEELIEELRQSYEVFAAEKDGTRSQLWQNTEKLWPYLFGKEINVKQQILEPVLAELAKTFSSPEYLDEMRVRFRI